jgi:hypothetical protein
MKSHTRYSRMSVKLALAGLCIALLASFWTIPPKKTAVFTCTTFFDFEKQDKWIVFCKAMDSILQQHNPEILGKINKWIIVNEYSPNPRRDWVAAVAERYPFCEIIQKGSNQKGQAASLNIILKKIKPFTYWIHWEETWYCRSPCLDRMFDVIEKTQISQLQVTQHKEKPNWLDSEAHPRELLETQHGTKYYHIQPSPGTAEFCKKSINEYNNEFIGRWPLYSLLPSINRTADVVSLGEFSTDPKLWPFKFEWDYGRRWLLAGNTKAVLPDGPVVRDNSAHKSTYSN